VDQREAGKQAWANTNSAIESKSKNVINYQFIVNKRSI
jgi:hypothetical protein